MTMMRDIQLVAARVHSVSLQDITGYSRAKIHVRPRQMAMALIRDLTDKSLPEIGAAFSGRHHTTVMHGIEADKARRAECLDTRDTYRKAVLAIEDYRSARFYRHGSIAPAFQSRRGKGGAK